MIKTFGTGVRMSLLRADERMRLFFFLTGIALSWAAVIWAGVPAGAASEAVRSGSGVIKALDLEYGTVVVEVPIDGEHYTVAGPLGPDAVLRRGGKPAGLEEFSAGEAVKIKWAVTDKGHEIRRMEGVKTAADLSEELGRQKRGASTVIGLPRKHVVKKGETLLDVARKYGLGFNEIQDLYSSIDPWIPPVGMEILIPTQWVLPDRSLEGIVINAAEMRLFMTGPRGETRTFPVALGVAEWPTPLGIYRIGNKVRKPVWQVPPSLREKYGNRAFPPGPENPLGEYWLGLKGTHYGLHGTDFVWSIGRLVTRGCIRLYPEDIRVLFDLVAPGTPVSVVYEPVKVGRLEGRVYVEVHRDIYGYVDDFEEYGFKRLSRSGGAHEVDLEAFRNALKRRDGIPADVTAGP